MTQQLRVGKQPGDAYCQALRECIREAIMSMYNRSKGQMKKLHRVGIASETNKVITRKIKRKQWAFGGHPDDTTVYRRLNEMGNKADFLVFVEPKGCGWYALSEKVFEKL